MILVLFSKKQMPSNEDIVLGWRKSPLSFIHDMWGLIPQPLIHGISPDEDWDFYGPEHFQPFIRGVHITWQQWLIVRAVEYAAQGKAVRWISVASGHGIGKSAVTAWLILWFLCCFTEPQLPCTAPTAKQMYDVLWKELKKWLNKMPPEISVLYDHQASYVRMKYSPETAFARASTAKKENTEALAGIHADNVLMAIDEASGVVEEVFDAAEGALTNSNIFVIMISNPTRLSGYFYDSHHSDKENWQIMRFDSRESPVVDWSFVQRILDKNGEDSPRFSVRVKGEFPDTEEDQLISFKLFDAAADRKFPRDLEAARIGGTDVARYGSDCSVHSERQGNFAAMLHERKGQDTMATCGDIVKYIRQGEEEDNPFDYWLIDIIGVGSGVFDRAKELQAEGVIPDYVKIIGVNVSTSPMDDTEYSNQRAELADKVRIWLATASIDPAFREQTCAIKYLPVDSKGRLVIEKKEDMKERGLDSPDRFDSLCLTFAIGAATRAKIRQRRAAQQQRQRTPAVRKPGVSAANKPWWIK